MKSFKEFMNEAKQVGIIYHFTTRTNIEGILSRQDTPIGLCDILGFASHNGYFSTTRDFMLLNDPFNHFTPKTHNIRIAFDGDKLSNKYKVKPINGLVFPDSDIFGVDKNSYRVPSKSEKEEVVCPYKNEKVYNLKDYVKEIYIYYIDKEKDDKLKMYIEDIIKKENLDVEVNIGRGWKPFKENFERDGNFYIV